MNSALERLLSLKVADIMTRDQVVAISPNQSLDEAAQSMAQHQVSGAPVVDEMGYCVGVLSAYDFVVNRHREHVTAGDLMKGTEFQLSRERAEGPLCVEAESCDSVRSHMSSAVQAINPEATLMNAARAMCAGHVHRLPVLDPRGHVLGIVSSLDVVAALVNAMEE